MTLNEKSLKGAWVRGDWAGDKGEGLVGSVNGPTIGGINRNPLTPPYTRWKGGWRSFGFVVPTTLTIIIPNEFT